MASIVAHYQILRPAAVLRAEGPDAFAFLQSQFSNDLRRPGGAHPATYGLWLDRKGKIMADSTVLQLSPEEFLIVSEFCPAVDILAHLQAHLIADEVELTDETGGNALLRMGYRRETLSTDHTCAGSIEDTQETNLAVEALFGSLRDRSWPCRFWQGVTEYLGGTAQLQEVVRQMQALGGLAYPLHFVTARRIQALVPAVPLDAAVGDLPQEHGLERMAVSFNKGCYLGQEVMARLHAMGHTNRSLWLVETDPAMSPDFSAEPLPLYAGRERAGELRSRLMHGGLALLKNRLVAGRATVSLSPAGPENVKLLKSSADL